MDRIIVRLDKIQKVEAGQFPVLELERQPSSSPQDKYSIAGDNFTHPDKDAWRHEQTALGILSMDDEVENLTARDSDVRKYFEIADKVRWKDVTIDLGKMLIQTPSLERIGEAVTHMVFDAWCPGDI